MLRAVEHQFNNRTFVTYPTYSASTTTLGRLMNVYTGVTAVENYAGPFKVALARPMEQSTQIPGIYPFVYRWSNTIDWVFLADNATAAATRRVVLYTYDRTTNVFSWRGFVLMTYPVATVHTIRGFRVTVDEYTGITNSTASVNGTAVTGVNTGWQDVRIAVGARIGFGTTDPTQVGTWYVISAIGSNTSITLSTNAGVISAGPFVIEEIRLINANTNATATNGGLFVKKGVNYDDFTIAGTTIPAAVSTDNIKAVYYLGDNAGTQVNQTACGMGLRDKESWTAHTAYVIDSISTPRVYAYNLRASLTGFASGKSGSAILFSTGTQAVTGALTQTNNGRIATLTHGPAAGIESLYFVTAARVNRASISGITVGSTTWVSDTMVEIPPGSTSTFPATGAFGNVEPTGYIDRLLVHSTGAAGARSYITKYNTVSNPFDQIFMIDNKQINQTLADPDLPPMPSINASPFSSWIEGGLMYATRIGTTAILNQLWAFPIGSDWDYADATGERLITPELLTPNVSRFKRVYCNHTNMLGDSNYGIPPEPFRMYYRTAGISDNSGGWTLLDDSGNLDGVAAAASIQFSFTFKMISNYCTPARIHSVTVLYEDETTDSHYQPSAGLSNLTLKQFAWRHSTAFGGTVPTLRVRLYDAVAGGGTLVDDDSATPTGTWERSTDGGSNWVAYTSTDKGNETTYIRYTPASLADNIRVRALLTQE